MDARTEQNAIPLAVDLDGSLIATDLLWEGLFALIRKQPHMIFLVPFWVLSGGPARLKCEIARRMEIDPAALPYRQEVIEVLREAKGQGRRIILATGSPKTFADAIAAHLGLFDGVLSTEPGHNMTSERKAAALKNMLGDGGFDYVGNSRHDLPLFDTAREALIVAPDASAMRWHRKNGGTLVETPKANVSTYLKMLRVHQWLKNVLIAVPMVLSHEFLNVSMIVACILAMISFSAAASAIYIINDFFDLALDRQHATKRDRPFASGLLSVAFGLACAAGLLVIAAIPALFLPLEFAVVLVGYLIATTAYSVSLKRMLLIDVMALAGLYTMRILAGAAATGMHVSFWLLAFSIFFFLSLALVKRYVELRTSNIKVGERVAGRGYRAEDQEIVGQAGMAAAFSSALVLALYINSDVVKSQYAQPEMIWPLAPIVLYMTMRIWILARRDEMHDDPIVFIIRDWRSQLVTGFGAFLILAAWLWT